MRKSAERGILPASVDNDLIIDEDGSPSAASAGARKALAQSSGAWKLLETPSELLRALRERADGLMGNLNQLHPSGAVLAGDLAEMQPSDLLNFLHQGRRTGVLLTRSDGVERGLVLLDGNVAWACSTSPGERLGELLCRMGLAERHKVEAALALQGKGQHRRLGQLLVDAGAVGSEQVNRGLRHQVVEIFLGLLVTRAGSFVFLRGVEREALPVNLALDTQALLLDGLRRLDEMELYRSRVPSSESRPTRTGRALPDTDETLTAEARQLYALVDGTKSIADLAMATALGEFEVTKAAFKLLGAGYLAL